ncbi:MAG: hypothetical protein IJT18_05410 [Oscillospiraceae bacterium]|nr:hypothetical protein [Oscillospiraceae bacterium]
MKNRKRIVTMLLTVCLLAGLLQGVTLPAAALPPEGFAANTLSREDMEKLVQRTMMAYFYKGSAVQYDSYYISRGGRYYSSIQRQTNNRDPEEAADLNPHYTVCSAFPHDVYYTIFGKHLITNDLVMPANSIANAGVDLSDYVPNDPRNNFSEAILSVVSSHCYHAAMAAKMHPEWDLGNPDRDTDAVPDPTDPYADVVYYFGPELNESGGVVRTVLLRSGGTRRLYTISGDTPTVASSIASGAVDASGAALTLANSYTVLETGS